MQLRLSLLRTSSAKALGGLAIVTFVAWGYGNVASLIFPPPHAQADLIERAGIPELGSDINEEKQSAGAPFDSEAAIQEGLAWTEMRLGADSAALNSLSNFWLKNPGQRLDIFASGSVDADTRSGWFTFRRADFDELLKEFPSDYRAYLARGLFYSSFHPYGFKYDALAIRDLKQAVALDGQSAFANFALGSFYHRLATYSMESAGDVSDPTSSSGGYQRQTELVALQYLIVSTKQDSRLSDGFAEAADASLHIGRNAEAAEFFSKQIALDPQNAIAFNDRGLAKERSGDLMGAIADFTQAISLQGPFLDDNFENRARVYAKLKDYQAAIDDYSHAIGMHLSQQIFLIGIAQFRTMYPELHGLSDDDLIEGLRQKFHPKMPPKVFAEQLRSNKPWQEFITAGEYTARGDLFLLQNDIRKALRDYVRAESLLPSADRWHLIRDNSTEQWFIDAQSVVDAKPSNVSFWIKGIDKASGEYDLQNVIVDCGVRRMKVTSATHYSADDVPRLETRTDWVAISPNSYGETIYRGMCEPI